MREILSSAWEKMDDSRRWELLNKTDLSGLQKCQVAGQPWLRIKAAWRQKLEAAYDAE